MEELTAAERAKGYVRPVRFKYVHGTCGRDTRLGSAIAEMMARQPTYYTTIMCVHCQKYFPAEQFTWYGTKCKVGS